MFVTKVLGEAVGIQYQGLIDRSGVRRAPSLSVGLIVGKFKRGRTDKPMLVTSETVRARLGVDLNNPDYLAVQDALDTGIPAVYVLRVA